jgi:hypothetical protein
MSVSLALLMAFTAAALLIAIAGVARRPARGETREEAAPTPEPAAAPPAAPLPDTPEWAPPEGSLLAGQLEIGQTFHLQTRTARYALTLLDPNVGLYDAVRVGPKLEKVVTERFKMLFVGSFVPNRGMRYGEFVLGGNLSYRKVRDGDVLNMHPSSVVERIFFCIAEPRRQAS